MGKKRSRRRFNRFIILLLVAIPTIVTLLQRRNTTTQSRVLIQGAGNSGNHIYFDTVVEELAELLAGQPNCPQISNEDLNRITGSIHTNALAGDPHAALVMFRVAQLQRKDQNEDQSEDGDLSDMSDNDLV